MGRPEPAAQTEQGDVLVPVAKDDVATRAGARDTDDRRLLPEHLEEPADQLNRKIPGEPTATRGAEILQEIAHPH